MEYTDSYYGLSHGTDQQSAQRIISDGFLVKGDKTSWCGEGVYFYDVKSKAWWAASRKCNEIKRKENRKVKPTIILVDIEDIERKDVLDLRAKDDLEAFEKGISPLLEGASHITIEDIEDEEERIILLRSMLISFYAARMKSKMIIGCFRQREQPLYEHAIKFADSLDMIIGIETIYCVKDTSIISNIRQGGKKNE